jgi:hypothetical protein
LKNNTAITVLQFSQPPGPNIEKSSISSLEVLKKAVEGMEPGYYSEGELREKLREFYVVVVVSNLGIAKNDKICLGVEG